MQLWKIEEIYIDFTQSYRDYSKQNTGIRSDYSYSLNIEEFSIMVDYYYD